MTRAARSTLFLLLLVVVLLPALAVPGAAAQEPSEEPLTAPTITAPTILPQPNSGEPPAFEGARGSTTQYVVLGLTVGGMATIVLLVARESKRKRSPTAPPLPDPQP